MSKYTDVTAYKLAVRIRTHKTILVEGVTDKKVISSFFLTHNIQKSTSTPFFVDDVSIISDTTLGGLGNKQKALLIASTMRSNKDKLACLVDREWDGIDFQNLGNSHTHPHTDALLTKGHSIENYWFHAEALISFLVQTYPDKLNNNYLASISENFHKMLQFSVAYSLTAKDSSALNRASELLSSTDLQWDGHSFRINSTIDAKLAERQLTVNFAGLCNARLAALPTDDPEQLRWLCHGHLGEQALRASAGALATAHGIDTLAVLEIERGNKPGKFHHDISFINGRHPSSLPPLDELLAWMRS